MGASRRTTKAARQPAPKNAIWRVKVEQEKAPTSHVAPSPLRDQPASSPDRVLDLFSEAMGWPFGQRSPGSASKRKGGGECWADVLEAEEGTTEDSPNPGRSASPRIRSRSNSLATDSDAGLPEQTWAGRNRGSPGQPDVFQCLAYPAFSLDPNLWSPEFSHEICDSASSWTWDPSWEHRSYDTGLDMEEPAGIMHMLDLGSGTQSHMPVASAASESTAQSQAIAEARRLRNVRMSTDTADEGWSGSIDSAIEMAKRAAQEHEMFIAMNAEMWQPSDCEGGMLDQACAQVDMNAWPSDCAFYRQEDFACPELDCERFPSWHEPCQQSELAMNMWGTALGQQQPDTILDEDYSAFDIAHVRVPAYSAGLDDNGQVGDGSTMDGPLDSDLGHGITTLMLHNIPGQYTRDMFVTELDNMGFEGKYDFLHIPVDRGSGRNVAYAFVNFITTSVAAIAAKQFDGYQFTKFRKHKRGGAHSWTSPAHLQGLKNNMDHYRTTTSRALILFIEGLSPHFESGTAGSGAVSRSGTSQLGGRA